MKMEGATVIKILLNILLNVMVMIVGFGLSKVRLGLELGLGSISCPKMEDTTQGTMGHACLC
jgi:hypothetical protein